MYFKKAVTKNNGNIILHNFDTKHLKQIYVFSILNSSLCLLKLENIDKYLIKVIIINCSVNLKI